ncbi:MAG: LON peptidase substrate-binding domain-containing protein [Planctomycetes bacterium]|nr:LON peptidase substrate-binding domain-containing protein [Planctomycetota bacterium]
MNQDADSPSGTPSELPPRPPSSLPEVVAAPLLVPMFPLADVYLFPGTFIPLHIFEPRYRQMIEDCLDGPGRIVMASLLEAPPPAPDAVAAPAVAQAESAPRVHPIGGLGEIARHERLEDGRFMIWLAGLTRVHIVGEPESDRLYRKVLVRPALEEPVAPGDEPALRARVVEAVLQRTPDVLNIPPAVPLGHLVDLLLLKLCLPRSLMQDAYAELKIDARARCALELHQRRPPPPPGEGNGHGKGRAGPSLN